MVKSVVRAYHWSPETIKDLYLDAEDFQGLEFWYNDTVAVSESLKTKK